MRCVACNCLLTPKESKLKFTSGSYVDLCTKCFSTISEDVVIDETSNNSEDEYNEDE